jgi:hypothetical protein
MDSLEQDKKDTEKKPLTKEEELAKKTKKGILIASITGGVLISLLTAILITGGILLHQPTTSYSGTWYKSKAGFYDENGNALSDAGSFSFKKIENDGSPYFELTGISLQKEGVKVLVLPVRSQDENGNTYYVRSVSDFANDNVFGSTAYDDSLTAIYGESFYQTIGSYAFSNLKSLTTLELGSPDSSETLVQTVGAFAFSNNPLLKTLHFSNGLKSVGQGVCANDVLLETADFSSSLLVSLGEQALTTEATYEGVFRNCASLTNVVLPSTLQTLGDHCFLGCDKLTNVSLNGTKGTFEKAASGALDYHEATLKTITCTDGILSL